MAEFQRLDRTLRALVATACAYETVAITTRKVPTITAINRRHPLFGGIVLGGLIIHFYHRGNP